MARSRTRRRPTQQLAQQLRRKPSKVLVRTTPDRTTTMSFLPQQPDLGDWRNPDVHQRRLRRQPRFWLDHDVDGFRMDVLGRSSRTTSSAITLPAQMDPEPHCFRTPAPSPWAPSRDPPDRRRDARPYVRVPSARPHRRDRILPLATCRLLRLHPNTAEHSASSSSAL